MTDEDNDTPSWLQRLDDAAEGQAVGHSADSTVPPALSDLFSEAVQQAHRAFEALSPAIVEMHHQFVEAGLVPEQPPEDPAARALHLRRHRNTGPAVHADPRRNHGRRGR